MLQALHDLLQRLLAPWKKECAARIECIQNEVASLHKAIEEQSKALRASLNEELENLKKVITVLETSLREIRHTTRVGEAASTAEQLKDRLDYVGKRLDALHMDLQNLQNQESVSRFDHDPSPEPDVATSELSPADSSQDIEDDDLEAQERGQGPSESQETRTTAPHRIPPERRGGRPRGIEGGPSPGQGAETSSESIDGDAASFARKPELLCLKRRREWKLVLVLPEELDRPGLQVKQGDVSLSKDGSTGWLLPKIGEDVEISWGEGEGTQTVRAFQGISTAEGLLFKLDAALEKGRRVKKVSAGWYLVVAPEAWQREGTPPIAPEWTSLSGYKAHFFDLSQSQRISFLIDGSVRSPWQKVQFELVGQQLSDCGERCGPLFRDPPTVRAKRSTWKQITTVVLGEEGSGRGRWRMSFRPDPNGELQALPRKLEERKGGWYFLRFYDEADELVDSCDFRFMSALEAIRVEPETSVVMPGPEGHRPARVVFHHEEGCRVELAEDLPVNVRRKPRQTVAELAPEPALDRTRWQVFTNSEDSSNQSIAVEVEVFVPRLWWALGEGEASPQEEPEGLDWQDQACALTRKDFAATSDKTLWLHLPLGIRRAQVGFPRDLRPFKVKVGSSQLAIPLREFTDAEPVRTPGTAALLAEFRIQKERVGVEVGQLEVRWACRWCDFSTFDKRELLDHLFKAHQAELYREPDYQKLRELVPELPPAIYQCHYCNEYVEEASDARSPTSAIINHIEDIHEKIRFRIIQVRFRSIKDPEEIRSKMEKYGDLPRFQICKLCNDPFDLREIREEELRRHIREQHWGEMSELQ